MKVEKKKFEEIKRNTKKKHPSDFLLRSGLKTLIITVTSQNNKP